MVDQLVKFSSTPYVVSSLINKFTRFSDFELIVKIITTIRLNLLKFILNSTIIQKQTRLVLQQYTLTVSMIRQ